MTGLGEKTVQKEGGRIRKEKPFLWEQEQNYDQPNKSEYVVRFL